MKDKILIIRGENDDYISNQMEKNNVEVLSAYRGNKLIFRMIRKFFFKTKLFSENIWYGKWRKNIDKYSLIIIFDVIFNENILEYICNSNKCGKIIFWYWNPVKMSFDPNLIQEKRCIKYSFDEVDSNKYSIKYNTQFYFKDIKNNTKYNDYPKYDVTFIGLEKGRLEFLVEFKKKMMAEGVSMFLCIPLKIKNLSKYKKYKEIDQCKGMKYDEVLKYVSNSKAVLDITQEGQVGYTLRIMEALFFSKKLITNNRNIIKSDFYNKANIFIIGVDNYREINLFINSPYEKVEDSVINKYDFENWLHRFVQNKELNTKEK